MSHVFLDISACTENDTWVVQAIFRTDSFPFHSNNCFFNTLEYAKCFNKLLIGSRSNSETKGKLQARWADLSSYLFCGFVVNFLKEAAHPGICWFLARLFQSPLKESCNSLWMVLWCSWSRKDPAEICSDGSRGLKVSGYILIKALRYFSKTKYSKVLDFQKISSDPYSKKQITSKTLQINVRWILLQWLFHTLCLKFTDYTKNANMPGTGSLLLLELSESVRDLRHGGAFPGNLISFYYPPDKINQSLWSLQSKVHPTELTLCALLVKRYV